MYATQCCSPKDVSCCHTTASSAWIPGVAVVDISRRFGYNVRDKAWTNGTAPAPAGRFLRSNLAMKIPCREWEILTDDSPSLSCSHMLIKSINREAPTFLGEFLSPEALQLQLNAVRDETPEDMDTATRNRLLDTFSADMREARGALLSCARKHSDVYYWAHPPGGNAELDAADRALAESLMAPPPDPDAESPAANATNGTDAAAARLRRQIAQAAQSMAGVKRVPVNVVWADPIPDVVAWSGRKAPPANLTAVALAQKAAAAAKAEAAAAAAAAKVKADLGDEGGGKMYVDPTPEFMLCVGAQLRKTCRMFAGSESILSDPASGRAVAFSAAAACADPGLIGRPDGRPARLCAVCCSLEPTLCGQSGWER